jgi:beta-lactamase class A
MILSASNKPPGWRKDRGLGLLGHNVIKAAGRRFPEAKPGDIALSLVLLQQGEAVGFSHRGDHLGYPASLVKLFFMVAAEAWLASGRLTPSRELREAVTAMVAWSSNDATSIVLDLLTRTTSGPALPPGAFARWLTRRQILNRYFAGWRCPEFAGINLVQKTWYEAPYGREHQSCYDVPNNRNRLSSNAVARLLLALAKGEAVDRPRSRAMLRRMERFPAKVDRKNPWNQVTGFLGEGLPGDARVWSKAGWSSTTRHDSAIVELADGTRFILVVMTYGAALAANKRLLPFIARRVASGVPKLRV